MARVYIDEKFADMREIFVKKQTKIAGKNIFTTNVDMMVFASMVGYSVQKDWKKDGVKNRGNEIEDSTFVDRKQDAISYLLALQAMKSGDILRDMPEENETQVWKIFESYSHLGFIEIEKWLVDNPGDTDGVDTLLNKIKEKAKHLFNNPAVDPDKIEF
jgi:dnd system-associated protein 4|tara:strand:+ start:39 stop:515 length:477 start_codon:yes stop_codon:yes gene_type:complete